MDETPTETLTEEPTATPTETSTEEPTITPTETPSETEDPKYTPWAVEGESGKNRVRRLHLMGYL
jgi:hypothetical protein